MQQMAAGLFWKLYGVEALSWDGDSEALLLVQPAVFGGGAAATAGISVEHWRAAAEVSDLACQAQPVASIADDLARVRAGELDLLVSCLNITMQHLRLAACPVLATMAIVSLWWPATL